MKRKPSRIPTGIDKSPGFALVVTLTLMVLLSILALGMLSLSAVSLSTASRSSDMAEARASAKLALMLAINQLQTHAGPDKRITTTAGQADGVAVPRKKWTAVYDSWDESVETRPTPSFRSWLVSGSPSFVESEGSAASGSPGDLVTIVGEGTVGTADPSDLVEVPLINYDRGIKGKTRIAWWVGDENVKAFAPGQEDASDNGTSEERYVLQTISRHDLKSMVAGETTPFSGVDYNSPSMRNIASWKQAELVADTPGSVGPLFHHLSASSSGMITNVRKGGFRKDLSLFLQAPESDIPTEPLYTVGGKDGINMSELWIYHNLWTQLETGALNYSTAGSAPANTPHLSCPTSESDFRADPFLAHKVPSFIRFQTLFSFVARTIGNPGNAAPNYRLGVVADPLITLWNPTDVPLDLRNTWFTSKYWTLPYDVRVTPSGQAERTTTITDIFIQPGVDHHQYMGFRAGADLNLVLKPGEVVVYSQAGNTKYTDTSKSGLGSVKFINGTLGFNFGGGVLADYRTPNGNYVTGPKSTNFSYRLPPNGETATATKQWSMTGHGVYFREDRSNLDASDPDPPPIAGQVSVNFGAFNVDGIGGEPYNTSSAGDKPPELRLDGRDDVVRPFFGSVEGASSVNFEAISDTDGNKRPFMIYSFLAKTEKFSTNPGRFLSRFNPRISGIDFFDLSEMEKRMLPFEVNVSKPNASTDDLLEVSPDGGAFFGGGWSAAEGTKQFVMYSIPRQPPVSLASYQHSMANGLRLANEGRPDADNFLHPQISHAIGNSMASPLLEKDESERVPSGSDYPRPMADHSFLANQALWDDWFLSGISPQTAATFTDQRAQQQVATEFFDGTNPLPSPQFKPNPVSGTTTQIVTRILPPAPLGLNSPDLSLPAANISVDGMFNVNSTSVEAWKSVLGALKDQSVLGQTANGGEQSTPTVASAPVSSLQTPVNGAINETSLSSRQTAPQWSGFRTLSETQIEELAEEIVKQVRARGPFLSLADFVNRRLGSDEDLAKSGAIQAALDSTDVSINEAFRTAARSAKVNTAGLDFSKAEEGAAAYGIAGYVKQADILTPIAPILSVRSDTFVIRGYGEALDVNNKVLATATCEAVVKRSPAFVDPTDDPTKEFDNLTPTNRTFGRRFEIVSFRWLNHSEI